MENKKKSPGEIRKRTMELQDGLLKPDQMRQIENAIHKHTSEFCDGYIFVGFVAGAKNEPIHLAVYDDARTGLALQKFMQDVLVPMIEQEDDDDDEPLEKS